METQARYGCQTGSGSEEPIECRCPVCDYEELDEFWDSVKTDRPDPQELIQVAAVAMRAVYEMTRRRHEQTPIS